MRLGKSFGFPSATHLGWQRADASSLGLWELSDVGTQRMAGTLESTVQAQDWCEPVPSEERKWCQGPCGRAKARAGRLGCTAQWRQQERMGQTSEERLPGCPRQRVQDWPPPAGMRTGECPTELLSLREAET